MALILKVSAFPRGFLAQRDHVAAAAKPRHTLAMVSCFGSPNTNYNAHTHDEKRGLDTGKR